MKVPTFYMDAKHIIQGDFDMYLSTKHDLFFRRIIEHITNRIEGLEKEDMLCRIIDEENKTYELHLPRDGFLKAMEKSLQYFKFIEEYETCGLIEELKKYI